MYPEKINHSVKDTWFHEDFWPDQEEFDYTKVYIHGEIQNLEMHSHNFYEINIVLQGEGRHYIEENSCEALPGCVFVIPPNIQHGYYSENALEILHIIISYVFMEQYSKELHAFDGYSILFEIEPHLRSTLHKDLFLVLDEVQFSKIKEIMQLLLRVNEETENVNKKIRRNLLVLYLIGCLTRYISSQKQLTTFARLPGRNTNSLYAMRAMEYIKQHYPEKISLDFLASQANMSRSTFIRHFQALCNCSPQAYQTTCRIEKAKELLRHTDFSASYIAQECGFYDSSHFIKIFSEITGHHPSFYRDAIQKGNTPQF